MKDENFEKALEIEFDNPNALRFEEEAQEMREENLSAKNDLFYSLIEQGFSATEAFEIIS
tara:strand:- start:93 stop:272 length:180 start_codon:yes stop_codon:yes gene_type:complete